MNDQNGLEKLCQTTLTRGQQQWLLERIKVALKNAIEARAPKRRPPGKAGLKAEKGYYRLLYLEADFNEKALAQTQINDDAPADVVGLLTDMLRQLTDLPELRVQFLTEIESAWDQINALRLFDD